MALIWQANCSTPCLSVIVGITHITAASLTRTLDWWAEASFGCIRHTLALALVHRYNNTHREWIIHLFYRFPSVILSNGRLRSMWKPRPSVSLWAGSSESTTRTAFLSLCERIKHCRMLTHSVNAAAFKPWYDLVHLNRFARVTPNTNSFERVCLVDGENP